MKKNEIIKKLEEFNKFAEELPDLSFINKLQSSGISFRFEKGKNIKTELRGPDEEAIKAFINDIRRFFQKGNDELKFYKLIQIYQSNFVNTDDEKLFNTIMSEFDKFNKQETHISINKKKLTNQKIFDVFTYGKYSHRTTGMNEIHDYWQTIPSMYLTLKNEFYIILYQYYKFINNIVYTNKKVLGKIEN